MLLKCDTASCFRARISSAEERIVDCVAPLKSFNIVILATHYPLDGSTSLYVVPSDEASDDEVDPGSAGSYESKGVGRCVDGSRL